METKKGGLNLHLKVWRQAGPTAEGRFESYEAKNISPDMSFLEMLDTINLDIIHGGEQPIAFDHDCREGICGSCSLVINGAPHGPDRGTATCQLHMRRFKDGDTIYIEPYRVKTFPIIKDLFCDRSAFDKIIASGGFVSVNAGNAQDANSILIPKTQADSAFEAAACIGCGACVAACKNGSAALFVGAKVAHLSHLPQGASEREARVISMVRTMDQAGFGACSNTGACAAVCPKEIRLENIALLNREYSRASVLAKSRKGKESGGFG